jgi:hypothetical protein
MKIKKSNCVLSFLLALLCIGCSQHRVVSQREFLEEVSRLKSGSKLSLRDNRGEKYSGALATPVSMLPDSSQVIIMENTLEGTKYQFTISPMISRSAFNAQISIQRKGTAPNVWAGAVLGTLAFGGIGLLVGNYLGEECNSSDGDVGCIFPEIIIPGSGAVAGLVTGFFIGKAMPVYDSFTVINTQLTTQPVK